MKTEKTKPDERYLHALQKRYSKAGKKDRGQTHGVAEFVKTTGYHRKHAIASFRSHRDWLRSTTPFRRLRRRIHSNEEQRSEGCSQDNELHLMEDGIQRSGQRLREFESRFGTTADCCTLPGKEVHH